MELFNVLFFTIVVSFYLLLRVDVFTFGLDDFQLGKLPLNHKMTLQPQIERRSAVYGNNATYLCNLKIILDHRFMKHVANGDKNRSVNTVVSLMSKVDKKFREIDFNEDGLSDNIGFYIDELIIHRDPIPGYTSSNWDPVSFFREMREYNFTGACLGLLFTFREMQTTEDKSPSLIKNQLTNEAQGICSTLQVTVPKKTMNDYGEFIANALPVNFRLNGHPASEEIMVNQVLHQLGNLFGAPNDDFYTNEDQCCRKMLGKTFIMNFPIPTSKDDSCFSPCSIMAMATYLSRSSRPCLRPCEGQQCDRPLLGNWPNPRYVTYPPTRGTVNRDWTEYCFTVPRSDASLSQNNLLTLNLLLFVVLLCSKV